MTRNKLVRYAVAAAAVALFATGCAGGQSGAERSAQTGSAGQFAAAASRGLHLDYTPLASPADAVAKGEVIVRGTLVEVREGITLKGAAAGRNASASYATAVIKVDEVIDGSAAAGGLLQVVLYKSSTVATADLAKLNRQPRVVAVLEDITTWTPAPGVRVVRPAGMPTSGPLLMAFPDGLWLQGSADAAMVGIHADRADLGAAWGGARTVDEYAAALRKA
jgi:hypothetical protein